MEYVVPPFQSEVGTYNICFDSFAGAFEALRKEEHTINGCTIRLYHQWYFAELKERKTVDDTLNGMIETLNNDCILEVMKYLDFEDLLYMANYKGHFQALVQKKELKLTPSAIPRPIGILTLIRVLQLFVETITSLEISLTSIRPGPFNAYSFFDKCAIIHFIMSYAGVQLTRVTFEGFLSNENVFLFRSYTWKLEKRGVEVIFS